MLTGIHGLSPSYTGSSNPAVKSKNISKLPTVPVGIKQRITALTPKRQSHGNDLGQSWHCLWRNFQPLVHFISEAGIQDHYQIYQQIIFLKDLSNST